MFIYCCIRLEDKILKTSDIEYINKFYEKYPCFEKNGSYLELLADIEILENSDNY